MFNKAVYQSFYFQYITNTTYKKEEILLYYNNFIMEMYKTVILSKQSTSFYNDFTAKSFSVHYDLPSAQPAFSW